MLKIVEVVEKNIKKRKECLKRDLPTEQCTEETDKSNIVQNDAKPDNKSENVDYETTTKPIINSSAIIRKLSNTKFKEDIIDSHNKVFFSSEKAKDAKKPEETKDSQQIDGNSGMNINSKDIIVDSIFFNTSNNIEKSIKDSESISSSEETFDLQINTSGDIFDLKEKNEKNI